MYILFAFLIVSIGGDDNPGNMGYRGKGYNPNFAHADEYPPRQEAVQTQKSPLDLSKHN